MKTLSAPLERQPLCLPPVGARTERGSGIFTTGAPRSGTTVLGRCLAALSPVVYTWEPFNSVYRSGLPDYYPALDNNSLLPKRRFYHRVVSDALKGRMIRARVEVKERDGIGVRVGKFIGLNRAQVDYWRSWLDKRRHPQRPMLIKDPIGVFLSGFLVEEFDVPVVATIRHPCAVALSRRELGWDFDFGIWRRQPELRVLLEGIDTEGLDPIEKAAIHWSVIYRYLHRLACAHPDRVKIVRHEDLCLAHRDVVAESARFMGLKIDPDRWSEVDPLFAGRTAERRTEKLSLVEQRDPRELLRKWQRKLPASDIDRVIHLCADLLEIYYPKG